MFKLLQMLSYFFRELIFESKDEYDIKSSKFNTRKVLIFALMFVSFGLNLFFSNRIYDLATESLSDKDNIEKLTKSNMSLTIQLEEANKPKEKNKPKVPSDSRNKDVLRGGS